MKQFKLSDRPYIGKKRSKKFILKKRFLFFLSLVVLLLVIISAVRFLSPYGAIQTDADWAVSLSELSQEEGTNYLLYGIIEQEDEKKVEDMFFLHFPREDYSPHMIFFPGETLFNFKENSAVEDELEERERINTFYTSTDYYSEGGPELLTDRLSNFLDVPIHHYVEVNYQVVPTAVENVGGLPYNDYNLTGEDFFDYFKVGDEEEGPLDRGLRRAYAFNYLFNHISEEKGLFASYRILRLVHPYIESNLSWDELRSFYSSLDPLFDPESMVLKLPGTWQEYYGSRFWEPDRSQVDVLMGNLGEEFTVPLEFITVEVLNGSGESGVASEVAEKLEDEGFDVVNFDNADHFDYERSQVISHVEDMEFAREIALLIDGTELVKEPHDDHDVMVTVIVGENY